MIALEQGEETGLCAGRALDAAKSQRLQAMLQLMQIENEIMAPQTGAFAHRGQLGRLEVREAERRPGRASERRSGPARR